MFGSVDLQPLLRELSLHVFLPARFEELVEDVGLQTT